MIARRRDTARAKIYRNGMSARGRDAARTPSKPVRTNTSTTSQYRSGPTPVLPVRTTAGSASVQPVRTNISTTSQGRQQDQHQYNQPGPAPVLSVRTKTRFNTSTISQDQTRFNISTISQDHTRTNTRTTSQNQHQYQHQYYRSGSTSGPAPVLPAKTNVSNVSRAHITSGADNFQQHEDLQHCQ